MDVIFSCQKRITKLLQILLRSKQIFVSKRFTHQKDCRIYSMSPKGGFERIPQRKLSSLSCGIRENARYSAGKTIKFSTNADLIDVLVTYKQQDRFSNMDVQMSSGLDVYGVRADGNAVWICCISPKNVSQLWAEGGIVCKQEFSSFLIFLPSYASIDEVNFRIKKGRAIVVEEELSDTTVLFYGSSITQGCAASRPGLNYVNQVALQLGCRVVNYGFSSSAKGEEEIAQLIAHEHASIYVIEYDHNATVDELKRTHQRLYDIVREQNPSSFIIFLSRISAGVSISLDEYEERDRIIKKTINHAAKQGDSNVCYIPGNEIVPISKRLLFVDDRHPNDRGMTLIAEQVVRVIKERQNDRCE